MSETSLQIKQLIKKELESAIARLYSDQPNYNNLIDKLVIDRPADVAKGHYSTNIALLAPKTIGISPVECGISLVAELQKVKDAANTEFFNQEFATAIDKIEVAGPGFVNFYVQNSVLVREINNAAVQNDFGKLTINIGKKIAYEYTDPNPFKVFHIGHLMANMVGESLSRLGEYTGADIRRFCYQGDLGRHVALFIYGLRLMDKPFPTEEEGEKMSLVDRMYYMGTSYARGATYAKEHPEVEPDIQVINKKLYEKSDDEINVIYDLGLRWSLEYFETLYELLGTKFNQYFFESACVAPAKELIEAGLKKGVFTESDGAIVFEGEKFADESKGEKLHTRVFITKVGLPTYDAKELGLAKLKYDAFNYDQGIIVTAAEQDQYFLVHLKALSLTLPELTGKNGHVSHGMMKLPTGKMSSRTGDVVSAEEFIESARGAILELMKERDIAEAEKNKIANQIAIAGIKYLILRQATGKDVIYDAKKALSFDGDSGPYLQYTCVRAKAILTKAKEQGIDAKKFAINAGVSGDILLKDTAHILNKIFIFPEVIERAYKDNSPHLVATYLIELAGLFNAFYAHNQIVDAKDDEAKLRSGYLVTLTQAMVNTLTSGLYVLGIEVPDKM